jgi:hypothetical protein
LKVITVALFALLAQWRCLPIHRYEINKTFRARIVETQNLASHAGLRTYIIRGIGLNSPASIGVAGGITQRRRASAPKLKVITVAPALFALLAQWRCLPIHRYEINKTLRARIVETQNLASLPALR